MRSVPGALVLAVLLAAGGCSACPPRWADALSVDDTHAWAAASCGEVFVEADDTRLALTRAARRLADHLGLDVERRLSVVLLDGSLYVEAVGSDGPVDGLDGLELVDQVTCSGRTHVRLRLPLDP
jgi:hypothetical protein